ncbi:hypothetical protein SAMN05421743_10366 [Thalassobacillus cyri]|uniref:Uncharacterized protein n=1 Tax=Thalassobacillus cyri TaxID=571932 RepID=A0A1H3YZQ2_9BACI|nr:hypothetical protein [Thalassobacillus cyri]SEA16572.1 hypothetical protein SAMN05421743_10366 [Thalassobacillus cyri]
MSRRFTHIFNSLVGILLIIEGGLYIFMMNKDDTFHLQSIIVTFLLLLAWGMSYRKQLTQENSIPWLTVTLIIMIPMILPWLFFI